MESLNPCIFNRHNATVESPRAPRRGQEKNLLARSLATGRSVTSDRTKKRLGTSVLVFLFLFFSVSTCASTPTTEPTHFVRYVENPDGSSRLEVAETAYENAKGVDVHLIGAVHIADPEFYEGLNEEFKHYDALLYELVSAARSRRNAGSSSCNRTIPSMGGESPAIPEGSTSPGLPTRRDRLHTPELRPRGSGPRDVCQTSGGSRRIDVHAHAALDDRQHVKNMSKADDVSGFELLAALLNPNSSRELKRLLAAAVRRSR